MLCLTGMRRAIEIDDGITEGFMPANTIFEDEADLCVSPPPPPFSSALHTQLHIVAEHPEVSTRLGFSDGSTRVPEGLKFCCFARMRY